MRNVIIEENICKWEHTMSSEFDEKVLEYRRLLNRECIVKLKQDGG